MGVENLAYTILFVVVLGIFLRRIYILLSLVLLGQGENRFDHLSTRLKALLVYGFGQARVVEDGFGVNHFFLFWGFLVLQIIVNVEFLVSGIFPAFSLRFVGEMPYAVLGFLADVTSAVVLLAVVIAAVRRGFFRPWYIKAKLGAFFILLLVALLMIATFGMNVSSIAMGEAQTRLLPISLALALPFHGMAESIVWPVLFKSFWWLHAFVLFAFMCYIPYSKHLHILTALLNCFLRRLSFPNTLPKLAFEQGSSFGISKVTQYSWKDLYDFLSCTECGRCAKMCPATDTGKTLNPMEVISAGKENMLHNGMELLRERHFNSWGKADDGAHMSIPLIGTTEESISTDAVWECTTCGACVEKCPVFIEQFPKLLEIRRHLVMEKVEFPPELTGLFENIEQRANPYGMAPSDRMKWADGLDLPLVSDNPHAEYLFFAGCVPSFNGRMKHVLTSTIELFKKGGISFAMLGKEEGCCGDTLRRLGNEYMFDQVANKNVEQFRKNGVKKIITFCPHCYNSFKNDYPAYGIELEVFHHTQIIAEILDKGAVNPTAIKNEKVVIHDACYLGRYNGVYEEPRKIIRAATGSDPLEMARNKRESFCCGAGGGQLWLHEAKGTRINTARTRQALEQSPSIVATSCPYCLVMFEDGLKDEKADERVTVLDVSELLMKGLEERKL
jgi:Fe-S oxidoreductase